MPKEVITNADEVSNDWLTAVLVGSGALVYGTIISFGLETGQANWSTYAKLMVTYSDDAKGALPRHLFLKMAQFDSEEEEAFGISEVTYYTRDYVDVKNAPLVGCYAGAYSEELKRYHLLLDDLSDTHIVAAEKEPTLTYGFALVEGLALLHAHWWGAERLNEAGAPIHNAAFIRRFVDICELGVEPILRRDPNELESHWTDTIRQLYAKHPQALIERTKDGNGFTLIHGDVGHHNILVPHTGDNPLYLIDRQPFNWSLTSWLGVYDLAYAIVLDWPTDARRKYEIPLLKRYHEHLIKHGVAHYSWEQLFDDYRLCVAMCVYISAEYCRGGTNKQWFHVWLLMLQRSLIACDDLNCSALWKHR
ncbi:MAG: hypothetical protein AAF702_05305 [Chloroflexota bacterium]